MKKYTGILILLQAFFVLSAFSQGTEKHVVFLKDKNNNPYSLSNPSAFLTQRSIDRRTRYSIPLDLKDLPVTPSYITQIAATGATVIYPMKWFNAVMVATADPSVLSAIAALPFVDYIDQVAKKSPVNTGNHGTMETGGIPPYRIEKQANPLTVSRPSSLDYGQAYNQTHMIALDALHDLGFKGEGMVIAQLDAGWNNSDNISVFDSLWLNGQILGNRDFELPGNNIFALTMHPHGTSVLSTMGSNMPGQIIGTAPHASYWLLRTEDGDIEVLAEEYNWDAGAEFADSVGADIINSSLGYTTFDNPVYNHTWADLDGNTTPGSRAAGFASSRGILVVNAAGNSGNDSWQKIGVPADNDSVLTLGAVDAWGIRASFSSTGPTADGRIKPDVATQGSGTAVVGPDGFVGNGYGTSFASPIMAGAMACLWQAHPAFTAEHLCNAIRNTASMANTPDTLLGYGIPNLLNAHLVLSTGAELRPDQPSWSLSPVPFSGTPQLIPSSRKPGRILVRILSVTGQALSSESVEMNGYPVNLDAFSMLPRGTYFVWITGNSGEQVLKAIKI